MKLCVRSNNGLALSGLFTALLKQAKIHNWVIQSFHGCSVHAENISMAFRRILNLEEAATATYRALVLGDKNTVFPPESFEALHHA